MQAEKEEEEEYRRQLMAKFAEDDRIEQMTAQKRRMKQLGKTYTYNKFVTGAIVNDSASLNVFLYALLLLSKILLLISWSNFYSQLEIICTTCKYYGLKRIIKLHKCIPSHLLL